MASISSATLNMVLGVCYDTFTFSHKLFHSFTLNTKYSGVFTLRDAALKSICLISSLASNNILLIPLPITIFPHEDDKNKLELTPSFQTSESYGEYSALGSGRFAPSRPYSVNRKLPERGAGKEVEIKAQLLSFAD